MNENLKRHRPDIKVLGAGKALAFMPEDPMGVWVHIQDVRDLLDVKDRTIRDYEDNYLPRAKTMELKRWMIGSPETGEQWVYDAEDVDRIIAAKDNEIENLKKKLESVQASMYVDVENRRLKRALWLALGAVHKAKAQHEKFLIRSHPQWEGTPAGLKTHTQIAKYENYERKCRAKAEEYETLEELIEASLPEKQGELVAMDILKTNKDTEIAALKEENASLISELSKPEV